MMESGLPTAEVEAAPGPTDKEIAAVRDLAEKALALALRKAKGDELLAQIAAELKDVVEKKLPDAMRAARLETWPMPGGAHFELSTIVNAGIPKDPQATYEAHRWLEEHGHGSLIKRRISIFFGREEIDWAKKFMRDCARRKKPLKLEEKEWVEPQTLGSFVREQLREAAANGRDSEEVAPSRLLGVFKLTYAKFVPLEPKRKTGP